MKEQFKPYQVLETSEGTFVTVKINDKPLPEVEEIVYASNYASDAQEEADELNKKIN